MMIFDNFPHEFCEIYSNYFCEINKNDGFLDFFCAT